MENNANKQKMREILKKSLNDDNTINAKILKEECFNTSLSDDKPWVFISHSHKDKKIVLELKEELEKDNDFNVFVDDLFWGITLKDVKEVILEVFKDKISEQELERHLSSLMAICLVEIIQQCCAYVVIKGNNITSNNKIESNWIYYELEMIRKLLPNLVDSFESKDNESVLLYDSELDKLKTYYNLQDLKKALKDLITPLGEKKETGYEGVEDFTLYQLNHKLFIAYKPNCTKE
ncbi:toll/interleukin-1 receptor domain-containing protein [Helicobacter cetorum]|uniref:toll/interleukin-1 receptor domain-containing protein n=1 Tax=Helicobacter cetorum TaxID=138563 RepID=UPI000CF05220|nr:toll/interleukin-1 receptor domain-containing protein [Helicobacter cetorum]